MNDSRWLFDFGAGVSAIPFVWPTFFPSGELVCEEDDLFEAGLSSITARHPFAALFCSSVPRGITVYQAPGV